MKKITLVFCCYILVHFSTFGQEGGNLLIENVNVINVETGKVKKLSVLVENGMIKTISKKKLSLSEVQTIDGEDKWLIPGLIDSHIHFFQSGGVFARPDALDMTKHKDYESEVKWVRGQAGDFLKRYLRCGITTVMDVGGPMSNFEIRKENSDNTSFPNIFLTGPLISTVSPDELGVEDSPIIKVSNAEEARKEVQKQLPFSPDFIKIWYIIDKDIPADSTYNIVKATIEESHTNGLKVAVHATQLHTAKLAIKAGADFLVHSVKDKKIDNEFIDLVLKNNVSYIPTLAVGNGYMDTFLESKKLSDLDFSIAHPMPTGSYLDLKVKTNEKLERIQNSEDTHVRWANYRIKRDSITSYNLTLLNEKGANIATGTDAGNIGTFHATSYYDELNLMKTSGLSNLDILKASTINAARVLNKENSLGSIEKDKMADMLILTSNPLESLDALKEIEFVIKNGKLYDVDSILKESPANLVQQQVNGYNARNIDAFLAPYSDDFEIYDFPNTLKDKGKDKIRDGYKKLFENVPDLHCEIVNRTVHGNTVIDQERITGLSNGRIIEAVAIYKIENGKIAKVYFLKSRVINKEESK